MVDIIMIIVTIIVVYNIDAFNYILIPEQLIFHESCSTFAHACSTLFCHVSAVQCVSNRSTCALTVLIYCNEKLTRLLDQSIMFSYRSHTPTRKLNIENGGHDVEFRN